MSLELYHKATSKELLAITNKVRNLVPHWGEDGRYKEAILKNVIGKFLPAKYSIGTGFIIKPTGNRGEHRSSRQIDLIIYDHESPVLFKEGDFVMLTPDAVTGIIEVKANIVNQNITDVVRRANENGLFVWNGRRNRSTPLFNGIFSYESRITNKNSVATQIQTANTPYLDKRDYKSFKVNHIAFNENYFLKYWPDEDIHSLYDLDELAFSFFISNLVDISSTKSVSRNSHIWFATDKELNKVKDFE